MLAEQVISYLESLFLDKREPLDAVQKLIIQYSWEGKKYEEMAECLSGYSLGYIRTNLAPELWSKLTHILQLSGLINSQEQITKKNVRIVLEPIFKRHYPNNSLSPLLQKLIKTLSQSDLDLATGREIAEVLWLAQKTQGDFITVESKVVIEPEKEETEETLEEPTDSDDRDRLPPSPNPPETEPQAEIVPPPLEQTSALDLPGNYQHIPVRDAPAIAQSLNFARALRPLARQIAMGLPTLLDEGATVEQIAETGVWQPVLKPISELWLEVALVFDRSPSMVLWQRLGLDLFRLLSHYGEFRDVRLWWLQPTETGEINLTRPNGTVCKPRDLLTSDRRRLVVIVSDCVGAAWHNGNMRSVIATWSAKLPTVLFQVFPERLWSRTALARSITVEFQAKQPGLPSDELKPFVRSVWDRERLKTSLDQHQVRIPVVSIEPESLGSLAAVLVGKRQSRVLGVVWDAKPVQLPPVPPIADQPTVALKDRIDSFVLLASPTARQLASLLASAPVITLPIVRLIKQAMLPQASALQIAEVLMSGLLEVSGSQKANFGNAERIAYQLVDEEVRERLRAGTRVADAQMVLKEVSSYVAENLGKSVDQFWALIRSPNSGKASEETAFLSAFATVSAQILRGLGPEFAEIADRLTLLPNSSAPDLEPEFAGIPPLEDFSFEVPTIILEEDELQSFTFRIATLKRQRDTWEVIYQEGEAQRFIEQLDSVELEMVAIPAGEFMMGSPENEKDRSNSESPQHQVKVSEFFMGRYPVTQAEWRAVAGFPKIDRELDSEPSRFKGDDRPVERVNWHEAVEFCQRLSKTTGRNYRLPSEAEWEYACRAGTKTPFHFGETITTDLANYDGNYVYGEGPKGEYRNETTPVGQFKVANNFGLCDLHGNVWEWCAEPWHSNYQSAPVDGSVWEEGGDDSTRVLRGGSWYRNPRYCRSAFRYFFTPDLRDYTFGFRVVCAVRGSV
jgi:formylglycine-generating enzyme required for sulfatase activity